jgi:hypothetical protein
MSKWNPVDYPTTIDDRYIPPSVKITILVFVLAFGIVIGLGLAF